MNREEAKNYINAHPEMFFKPARKKGYVCPLCGNGTGKSGDGLSSPDNGKHWNCFKCTTKESKSYGDVIDWIAKVYGLEEGSAAAFEQARQIYNIELTDSTYTPPAPTEQKTSVEIGSERMQEALKRARESERYLAEALKHRSESNYLEGRGIAHELILKHDIGYDVSKRAIVFPLSSYIMLNDKPIVTYCLRRTEAVAPDKRYLYADRYPLGFGSGLFNIKALLQAKPVFVCEGAIDALSVLTVAADQVGAVAINSVANADAFIKLLKHIDELPRRTVKPPLFCIMTDSDTAGVNAADTLREGLEGLGYPTVTVGMPEGVNDVNELLQTNREQLRQIVLKAAGGITEEAEAEIQSHTVGALFPQFREYIKESRRFIPTGFTTLDSVIGGGLYPRLYTVTAITSLGKTTLVLQIADNIAAYGEDVLIFSLEMGKEDLIARSISRHTYQIAIDPNSKYAPHMAKTEQAIINYGRNGGYSDTEKELIHSASEQYLSYASEHISIYEGKHTADDIYASVKRYISVTGKHPVVIVDYLQIIRPTDKLIRASDKQVVDYSTDVLTAIKRELKCPVVAISSIGRAEYGGETDIGSMKESGSIEYSADAVIGLDFDIDRDIKDSRAGVREKEAIIKQRLKDAKAAIPRKVILTLHKNRGNRAGERIHLLYDPRFNHFKEM